MSSFADRIDRLTAAIGGAAAWLCLFIVLVQFAIVLMRYFLGRGFPAEMIERVLEGME